MMGKNNEIIKPNFWAVIPATVRYDDVVGSTAKLLFAEITALSNQEGYSWASNLYFANLFKISVTQVSRLMHDLEERGFIKTEVSKEDGNQRKIYPQINSGSIVKENKGKTFEERFDELVGVVADNLKEERIKFIEYFTAVSDGGKKQHWQKQKTFAMRQRWATWIRNKIEWTKPKFEKLPSEEELRKKVISDVEIKNREKEEKEKFKQVRVARTPEEQDRVNKKLAEIREKLGKKFALKNNIG